MNTFEKITAFVQEIIALGKERGIEVKDDGQGLALWPTYKSDGGLDQWVAVYLKLPTPSHPRPS